MAGPVEVEHVQADAPECEEHPFGGRLGGRPLGVSRINIVEFCILLLQGFAHREFDQANTRHPRFRTASAQALASRDVPAVAVATVRVWAARLP